MIIEKLKNFYKNKKIFVTGHTGFKGSWLTIFLQYLGADVFGFSLPPITQNDNYVICKLKMNEVIGNIQNINLLLQTIKQYSPDIIFHLAAQPLVLKGLEYPYYTYRNNIMCTLNILECIKRTPSVKIFVNVTSDKSYKNKEWPYRYREIDELAGIDPYSASKSASEIISLSYYNYLNINWANARAGNIIGGGDWAMGRLLPNCIYNLQNNKPIILRTLTATRSFLHVLEIIYGYILLGFLLDDKKYNGVYNFGYNKSTNIEELIKKVIQEWGSGEYIYKKNKNKEADKLDLDNTKARYILGWEPILSLDTMIKLTIEEYRVSTEEALCQRNKHIETYLRMVEYELCNL